MKEHNGLYRKLKSHGVTIYAVAKAGGWSWQQVASWVKGTRMPHFSTFGALRRVLQEKFDIEIDVYDIGEGGKE